MSPAELTAGGVDLLTRDEVRTRDRARRPHDNELTDWFCLESDPWTCSGCHRTFHHEIIGTERGHLVVVWPESDDPEMLRIAAELQKQKDHPKIVPYERSFGACVSFYKLAPLGIEFYPK